jgi:uncharacterized protein YndB with AHSA1/START domain
MPQCPASARMEENGMLEIIAYLASALLLVALAIVAIAARKPDSFQVQRSTRIAAPAHRIFPLIADLRAMNTWNPFVEPDPAIEITYSGPMSGKGAAHTWRGNRNVGEGRIEIADAVPPSKVALQLDMLKPMKAHNAVTFTLRPDGDATEVTWAMSGRQPLIGKVMTMFIDCDRMVGSQFEKGLAKLKTIAEK